MIYAAPMPFREALDSQEARAYLPTDFRSADLAKLDPALLRRAQFSARTTDLGRLDNLGTIYRDILAGRLDRATGRLLVKQYIAVHGPGGISTNDGGLQDFAGDTRINLQIDTNVEMMRGLGNELQGQQPEVLDAYPARELIRVIDRKVPRDWVARWDTARAATTMDGATSAREDGRMVAIVGHPIWRELNRFGNDYAPFDFNSGMGLEDVSRREAMSLGIIDRDTQIFPDQSLLRPDVNVQTSAAVNDPRLRAALERTGLGRFDADGIFRLVEEDDNGDPIANRAAGDGAILNTRSYERDSLGRFASDGGPLSPSDNIARGNSAIDRSLRTKADVPNAMNIPGLGRVDLPWGRSGHTAPNAAGKTHTDGYGVSHILAKHGEKAVRALPVVLTHGAVRPHNQGDPAKRSIYHGRWVATVGKTKKDSAWVITNFEEVRR